MKSGMTIEQYMEELEDKKARAEAFAEVISYIDSEIKWKCEKEVEVESHYEEYVDDNGETKKRFVSPKYKKDDNGDYIFIEPEPGDWNYKTWNAYKNVREEIIAII